MPEPYTFKNKNRHMGKVLHRIIKVGIPVDFVFVSLICQLDLNIGHPDLQFITSYYWLLFCQHPQSVTVQAHFWRELVGNAASGARVREEGLWMKTVCLRAGGCGQYRLSKGVWCFSLSFISFFFQSVLPWKICPGSYASEEELMGTYIQMQIEKKSQCYV